MLYEHELYGLIQYLWCEPAKIEKEYLYLNLPDKANLCENMVSIFKLSSDFFRICYLVLSDAGTWRLLSK